MNDNMFTGFIAGFSVACCACIIIILACSARPADVYQRAYADMKEGRIEQYVKEQYPRIWLKYNDPNMSKSK
jgi:hypothetical protein